MRNIQIFLLCSFFVLLWSQAARAGGPAEIAPDWKVVEKRLLKAGFKQPFIKQLKKTYEPADFKNVIELNLDLFLRKVDHHGVQVTDEAAEKIRGFMDENEDALATAEKESGVPPAVVSSLLWMESRYGQNLGRFHVASVFVDLIQSDLPAVIKHLKTAGAHRFSPNPSKKDLAKIAGRTKTKVKWALGELKAIERIYKEKGPIAFEMRGSFAGAFGMAQFEPSSYARWARAAKPGAPPDLTSPPDAIRSVAFYLHSNGWRKLKSRTHVRALMNYNNSRDYANAILSLAEKATASTVAVKDPVVAPGN